MLLSDLRDEIDAMTEKEAKDLLYKAAITIAGDSGDDIDLTSFISRSASYEDEIRNAENEEASDLGPE